MTQYRVTFMPQASDDPRRLNKKTAQRILHKLRWLSQNFGELRPEKLTGEFRGFCKLSVGSHRILYTVNTEEHLLTVHLVGHRRDIYKH